MGVGSLEPRGATVDGPVDHELDAVDAPSPAAPTLELDDVIELLGIGAWHAERSEAEPHGEFDIGFERGDELAAVALEVHRVRRRQPRGSHGAEQIGEASSTLVCRLGRYDGGDDADRLQLEQVARGNAVAADDLGVAGECPGAIDARDAQRRRRGES